MDGNLFVSDESYVSQIKNAVRTAQATAAFNKDSLNYYMLKNTLDTIGDFSGIEEVDGYQ
jgi:hypothetical protein